MTQRFEIIKSIKTHHPEINIADIAKVYDFLNDSEAITESPNPFDWDAFRAEAAKDLYCAQLSGYWANPTRVKAPSISNSIEHADALISELQKPKQ